jgi:hypothetical protein
MSKSILLSDFTTDDPIAGGSEFVDRTVAQSLGLEIVRCKDWTPDFRDKILVSNISTLPQSKLATLTDRCNYSILEHDYKIHPSRHPWRFKDCLVPINERVNYELYRNANAVFTQTQDHLDVFQLNQVKANFINLKCSIWSEKELTTFVKLQAVVRSQSFAVIDSKNWIKATEFAVKVCQDNKWNYELISSPSWEGFINKLAGYSALAFFPVARESCCRVLVEARCLGLNVITSPNSGAFKSDWFSLSGVKLIEFLNKQSKINLDLIKECL